MHQHVVKQGDTLWKLSKAWGVPLSDMIKANPQLKNPNVLLTGEIVNIPKTGTPANMPDMGQGESAKHPLHPMSLMQGLGHGVQQGVQGVQGIMGKMSTAPFIGKKPTGPIMPQAAAPLPTPLPAPVPAPAPVPQPAPMPVMEKPVEKKVYPIHIQYEQHIDLFKQYGTPAKEVMSLYNMPQMPGAVSPAAATPGYGHDYGHHVSPAVSPAMMGGYGYPQPQTLPAALSPAADWCPPESVMGASTLPWGAPAPSSYGHWDSQAVSPLGTEPHYGADLVSPAGAGPHDDYGHGAVSPASAGPHDGYGYGYGPTGISPAGMNPYDCYDQAAVSPANIGPHDGYGYGYGPTGISPAGMNPYDCYDQTAVSPANIGPHHGYGYGPTGISPAGMNPYDCYDQTAVSPANIGPHHGYGYGPTGISPAGMNPYDCYDQTAVSPANIGPHHGYGYAPTAVSPAGMGPGGYDYGFGPTSVSPSMAGPAGMPVQTYGYSGQGQVSPLGTLEPKKCNCGCKDREEDINIEADTEMIALAQRSKEPVTRKAAKKSRKSNQLPRSRNNQPWINR
nr:LysM peptidoglycan-binding domain-containing protein [Paenibacillus oenotherae]